MFAKNVADERRGHIVVARYEFSAGKKNAKKKQTNKDECASNILKFPQVRDELQLKLYKEYTHTVLSWWLSKNVNQQPIQLNVRLTKINDKWSEMALV